MIASRPERPRRSAHAGSEPKRPETLKRLPQRFGAAALPLLMLLAGCQAKSGAVSAPEAPAVQESRSSESKPASAPSPAPSPASDAPAIAARLKTGASYADTRKVLADAGWLPLQDWTGCRNRLGEQRDLCTDTSELVSCDGKADTCVLQFGDASTQRTLALTVAFQEAGARFGAVQGWAFAAAPAMPESGRCPAGDFDGFLKAFSSSDAVRAAYTAPLLRVTRMSDQGVGGYIEETSLVAAKDYADFFLAYRDGAFRIVNSAGVVGPDPIALNIEPRAGGAYFVSIPDDVEGISYLFEPYRGCWRLTADPVATP